VTASDPTIVDVVSNIVDSIHRPVHKVLSIVKTFFYNPITDRVAFFGSFFPETPLFAGTSTGLGCTT
jgi:hypothetical protein